MEFVEKLKLLLSEKQDFNILWNWLLQSEAGAFLSEMQSVMQNPIFHGEGNVYLHTKMVCEALMKNAELSAFSLNERAELFLAVLLHDIGKIKTTAIEDGNWISPHHSSAGSHMTRTFLWQECGLCGSKEAIETRESICGLIRYHMLPVHMIDQEDAALRIRQVASVGELAKGFSWQKLCMIADADIQGRIAGDINECREKIALCRILAEESGCLYRSYPYHDIYTKHAYLRGRNVLPDQALYDDTWGEVTLMSGLPGSGKDTWISGHLPELPMISLDDIRKEMKVKPTDDQGAVIQEARARAKVFLRKKQPFVWNATNLSREIRQKQIRLFEQYGASVKIVYLETDEKKRKERNTGRADAVPEEAVNKLLRKTELPLPEEARAVEWVCV
ncbi:MAG: AAA family ATPase [Eubacteriales bacterium]|nr:AAA family ATPase [Eubacteriales bacterium]